MLPRKQGSIVNIASMSGIIVNRGLMQAHYNASKAAVIHLSKSLAMEWIDRGVRVNSISPGYTATPMNLRPEMAWQTKKFETDTPIGRMANVDGARWRAIWIVARVFAGSEAAHAHQRGSRGGGGSRGMHQGGPFAVTKHRRNETCTFFVHQGEHHETTERCV